MKNMLKTHLLTVLCVVSLIAMFLPFANISTSMSVAGSGGSASQSVTGFSAAKDGILGFVLLIGPAVLIAMNYVKQLEKYKSILAVAVPVICVVVGIIVLFQAKSSGVKASGGGGLVDIEVKMTPAIGSIIALLSYIGTGIVGAMTYHDLTLDKAGLERLKQEGGQFLKTAKASVSEAAQNVSGAVQSATAKGEASVDSGDAPVAKTEAKPAAKKSVNLNKTDEVLAMIEKLSKMKDAGVLTEEEFNEKKKQLLSEI